MSGCSPNPQVGAGEYHIRNREQSRRTRNARTRSSSLGLALERTENEFRPVQKIGVGSVDLDQPSISKMHSISTAMPPGSELWPTALRAPTPASSPNTSFISSENPLITFG
ncbi:hypothetical protein GobsT_41970 [Gemmata obscuriglobus]|nr:hypothetical protein GobsT_41970 [Gemmata obscuriglobus]VTS08475.1 unnamed protein product [Gemmata obscuriglobus UQM 2246]